jgi:hypothetical protein
VPEETKVSVDEFYGEVQKQGQSTDIPMGGNLKIRVFPVRGEDVIDASEQIKVAVRKMITVMQAESDPIASLPASYKIVMDELSFLVEAAIVPWSGDRYLEEGCKIYGRPSLKKLHVHKALMCVADWVSLSFSKENLDPLFQTVAALIKQATGKELDIWSELSALWSGTENDVKTSAIAGDQAGPIAAGPTPKSASDLPSRERESDTTP